jgi:Cu-processing system ATP-binding protein
LAARGAAILLSSHALTEVEARTDRIAILARGRLVANDTLAMLRRAAALPIRFQIAARADSADEVARRLTGTRCNGEIVNLVCPPGEKMARLGQIADLGPLVADVEVLPPSLEDIYSHFSGTEAP